ncbi:uncharacterized protein LOC141600034 isoform X2 [Silene latifolia]|uniref:uncharacterized protein LOC141600034 isoform X2 n=2 Tax=Silene latifolia TaxID=37657 RepID=UPI003D7880D0
MTDEVDKTCPLCAEEMDVTDQQLKPCRCGYEVCVWCWHHIMEMAEKDETEGRCPACRTPYDKERIVGTAANCERLVAEVSIEKKHKTQKAKIKTSESRKQLTSVRVIQRNLVYIVGLPLDLADEDLLQRKEYFGQYGKVSKVSISRTSAGTIQQFANNTCSVYITYAREDEAVRCIQSVHAFILDGRPLRACFGTTKYCHAWLRSVPCSNPDCLYLHEIGSTEDSFTKDKDEFISAYSRVQQITGVTNNMQRRSGSVLPSPADDYCDNSSTVTGKPVVKSSSNSSVNITKGSLPSSSSGKSGGLPPAASWGARASTCNTPAVCLATSNGPTKQKAQMLLGQPVIDAVVSGTPQTSNVASDLGKSNDIDEETHTKHTKCKMDALANVKQRSGFNSKTSVSETSSTAPAPAVKSTNQQSCSLETVCYEGEGSMPQNTAYSFDKQPCSSIECEQESSTVDINIQNLPNGMSSVSVDKQPNGDYSAVLGPIGLSLENFISHRDLGLQWHESEKHQQCSGASLTATTELLNLKSDVQAPTIVQNMTSETEDDFDNQRLRDAVVSQAPGQASSHILNHLRAPLQLQLDAKCTGNSTVNPPIVNTVSEDMLELNLPNASVSSNGFLQHLVNESFALDNSLLNGIHSNHLGRSNDEVVRIDSKLALDMGESNIISNILSLDLDSWDDSLTSQNLAKLFTDKQEYSIKSANSWKSQISNQSRFSFARQEDSMNHLFHTEPTLVNNGHTTINPAFGQGFVENRDPYLDRLGNGFGIPHCNMELSDNLVASRSQISAPPGFTVSSMPPPPGFSSQERSDRSFDFLDPGNQMHEYPFFRNSYQTPSNGNISPANDIEFIDPAILAVGKGRLPTGANILSADMRPNFHLQTPGFEEDLRLQFLMQRSISPHQNLRYTDVRDNLSPPNEAYRFNYRYMEQPQANNVTPFSQYSLQQPRNTVVSNGLWDGWSEMQSPNDIGIAELLRNDRLGFNKFHSGYEDSKF